MPSFDIVSKLNLQEVDNAVNQTQKEIGTRYDLKNSKSEIRLEKEKIFIQAEDDSKMEVITDILKTKATKRAIAIQALNFGKVESSIGGSVKCEVSLIQGIESEKAKEVVKLIKELKLKVAAQIQDEQVRVTGKSRDDLQEVIRAVKGKDFKIPLQFENFRD